MILILSTLGIGGCSQERLTAAYSTNSSRVRLLLPSIALVAAAARATLTARHSALDGFGQDVGLHGGVPLVQHHHTRIHHLTFAISAALLVQ